MFDNNIGGGYGMGGQIPPSSTGYYPQTPMQQVRSYQSPYSSQNGMALTAGRMVYGEEEIRPNEIPMDGNIGAFIQRDLKMVYLKTWGGNGTINTNRYVLVDENQPVKEGPNPFETILERLERIENFLSRDQSQDVSQMSLPNQVPQEQKEKNLSNQNQSQK